MEKKQLIDEAINKVLNEEEVSPGMYSSARGILNQIKDAEQIVRDLQLRIAHLREQLISTLSGEIRKRQPKLELALRNGKCLAGYKSNNIALTPDFERGTWNIDGSLGRRFVKEFPHLTNMSDDISPLADAISSYFNRRYKTLGV